MYMHMYDLHSQSLGLQTAILVYVPHPLHCPAPSSQVRGHSAALGQQGVDG